MKTIVCSQSAGGPGTRGVGSSSRTETGRTPTRKSLRITDSRKSERPSAISDLPANRPIPLQRQIAKTVGPSFVGESAKAGVSPLSRVPSNRPKSSDPALSADRPKLSFPSFGFESTKIVGSSFIGKLADSPLSFKSAKITASRLCRRIGQTVDSPLIASTAFSSRAWLDAHSFLPRAPPSAACRPPGQIDDADNCLLEISARIR